MKVRVLLILLMSGLAGSAGAHVANLPPLEHAADHLWLLLTLLPVLLLLVPALGRLRAVRAWRSRR